MFVTDKLFQPFVCTPAYRAHSKVTKNERVVTMAPRL
jgi:hypothetical protein